MCDGGQGKSIRLSDVCVPCFTLQSGITPAATNIARFTASLTGGNPAPTPSPLVMDPLLHFAAAASAAAAVRDQQRSTGAAAADGPAARKASTAARTGQTGEKRRTPDGESEGELTGDETDTDEGAMELASDNTDEGASPDQDRGRGRGKSSGRGEGLISNTGAGAAQGQPKRGRGRPKGSKNKQHLVQSARTKSAAAAGVAAAAAHAHPPRQQRSAPAFDLPGQQPVVRSSGRQTAPVRQWPSD